MGRARGMEAPAGLAEEGRHGRGRGKGGGAARTLSPSPPPLQPSPPQKLLRGGFPRRIFLRVFTGERFRSAARPVWLGKGGGGGDVNRRCGRRGAVREGGRAEGREGGGGGGGRTVEEGGVEGTCASHGRGRCLPSAHSLPASGGKGRGGGGPLPVGHRLAQNTHGFCPAHALLGGIKPPLLVLYVMLPRSRTPGPFFTPPSVRTTPGKGSRVPRASRDEKRHLTELESAVP